MVKIREAIVVEGRYDKNTLSQIVDAPILETSGFGIFQDKNQLKLLRHYVFSWLSNMVDDIASGNVSPNPYTRGTTHNACAFCPYGAICAETAEAGRRNYKTMTAQRFWEEVEKEVKRHG